MKAVSLHTHCIPCYDFLRRLENVAKLCETTIPIEMSQMEEKTGSDIVTKAYEVANSDFYANIPDTVTIQSGANPNYIFDKSAEKAEIIRIMNEVK